MVRYPFLVCGTNAERNQIPIAEDGLGCVHKHNATCVSLTAYCKAWCPGGTQLPVPKQYFYIAGFITLNEFDGVERYLMTTNPDMNHIEGSAVELFDYKIELCEP